jgi:alanine racemase
MTIGLIPVGYYEFFSRRLSNRGFISYQDKFLPLVGNICMNLSMCSLEGANIQVGDRIKIISPNPEDLNSVYQFAKLSETITYEVLVKLAESLRRVVVP